MLTELRVLKAPTHRYASEGQPATNGQDTVLEAFIVLGGLRSIEQSGPGGVVPGSKWDP